MLNNNEGFPHQETEKTSLNKITYVLPENPAAQVFTNRLLKLLHVEQKSSEINLDRDSPENFTPATYWSLSSEVVQPNIVFSGSLIPQLQTGSIQLGATQQRGLLAETQPFDITSHTDNIGTYVEGVKGNTRYQWLSMEELANRLKNAEVSIDHTGINIPTREIDKDTWRSLIAQLGKEAVVFDYPNEPWPFIVPATKDEKRGKEITDLKTWRGPKFEFVYDPYVPVPLIQFSFRTNLSKEDVHRLFPGPYATTFPELADIFRSVYVQSPWDGLAIRVDLNYRFESTEDRLLKYLLTEGKRV